MCLVSSQLDLSGGYPCKQEVAQFEYTTSVTTWEDKTKDMVDFRAGCFEKGHGNRHIRQGVAPL